MEKEQSTAHETVEEKIAKDKSIKEETVDKSIKEEPADKSIKEGPENKSIKEESEKEGLNDSDIIDINKKEEKKEEEPSKTGKSKRGLGGKNAPKTTDDFIKKQKKRKRTRRIITLCIIVGIIIAIVLWARNKAKQVKDAFSDFQSNNVQTSFVEKKTLYDSKNATGTLFALESRTISRSLQGSGNGGAKIDAINVSVGDHVTAGDVLVEFSSENIEKSIAETKEDIGTQKQLDAINKEDAQRTYVTKYEDAATSMKDAAQAVDEALKDLYEACDAYGDAKENRDKLKNMSDSEKDEKYITRSAWEQAVSAAEDKVYAAYQNEQAKQKAYDKAVLAQSESGGGSVNSVANSLAQADSDYKKAQINANETVKQKQRQLNNYIDSLDDYVVYATIDGVVTEVNVSEGNTFTSGNVLTIQDDSGYKADVLVDEYDIPKVKKAYEEKKAKGEQLEVVVKTDATGENEYRGHVTLIAPTSTSTTTAGATSTGSSGSSAASAAASSSTANYKVSIELDELDDAFMIGMSAKVAIVVNQSPANSLCVPYNCVEERDGKFIVKVMDEHGDKSTADNIPGMNGGKPGFGGQGNNQTGNDETKGVNGIVIENDSDNTDSDKKSDGKKKVSIFDKLTGEKDKDKEVEVGRRYREVEVDKIFDTDYYAAVVPKTEGSLKEGDEVMVVTEKSSGNDIMAMFGGPGGGPR